MKKGKGRLLQGREKLKQKLATETHDFLKKGNCSADSGSFLSGIILSTLSPYMEQSYMPRYLSLILVSSKRSLYSLKMSWLQFRDKISQDVPKMSYCQKTKVLSRKEVNQLKKGYLMAKLWQHNCQCENSNYSSLEPTEAKRHPKYKND